MSTTSSTRLHARQQQQQRRRPRPSQQQRRCPHDDAEGHDTSSSNNNGNHRAALNHVNPATRDNQPLPPANKGATTPTITTNRKKLNPVAAKARGLLLQVTAQVDKQRQTTTTMSPFKPIFAKLLRKIEATPNDPAIIAAVYHNVAIFLHNCKRHKDAAAVANNARTLYEKVKQPTSTKDSCSRKKRNGKAAEAAARMVAAPVPATKKALQCRVLELKALHAYQCSTKWLGGQPVQRACQEAIRVTTTTSTNDDCDGDRETITAARALDHQCTRREMCELNVEIALIFTRLCTLRCFESRSKVKHANSSRPVSKQQQLHRKHKVIHDGCKKRSKCDTDGGFHDAAADEDHMSIRHVLFQALLRFSQVFHYFLARASDENDASVRSDGDDLNKLVVKSIAHLHLLYLLADLLGWAHVCTNILDMFLVLAVAAGQKNKKRKYGKSEKQKAAPVVPAADAVTSTTTLATVINCICSAFEISNSAFCAQHLRIMLARIHVHLGRMELASDCFRDIHAELWPSMADSDDDDMHHDDVNDGSCGTSTLYDREERQLFARVYLEFASLGGTKFCDAEIFQSCSTTVHRELEGILNVSSPSPRSGASSSTKPRNWRVVHAEMRCRLSLARLCSFRHDTAAASTHARRSVMIAHSLLHLFAGQDNSRAATVACAVVASRFDANRGSSIVSGNTRMLLPTASVFVEGLTLLGSVYEMQGRARMATYYWTKGREVGSAMRIPSICMRFSRCLAYLEYNRAAFEEFAVHAKRLRTWTDNGDLDEFDRLRDALLRTIKPSTIVDGATNMADCDGEESHDIASDVSTDRRVTMLPCVGVTEERMERLQQDISPRGSSSDNDCQGDENDEAMLLDSSSTDDLFNDLCLLPVKTPSNAFMESLDVVGGMEDINVLLRKARCAIADGANVSSARVHLLEAVRIAVELQAANLIKVVCRSLFEAYCFHGTVAVVQNRERSSCDVATCHLKPWLATLFLGESLGLSLRHELMTSSTEDCIGPIARPAECSKRCINSSGGGHCADTQLSSALKNMSLSNSANQMLKADLRIALGSVSFSDESLNNVRAVKSKVESDIPIHWSICSVAVSADCQNLLISRMWKNEDDDAQCCALCLPLAGTLSAAASASSSPSASVYDYVQNEFDRIMLMSKQSAHAASQLTTKKQKKCWWNDRYDLDAQLHALLGFVEASWLGVWRGALSGIPLAPGVRASLLAAADDLREAAIAGISDATASAAIAPVPYFFTLLLSLLSPSPGSRGDDKGEHGDATGSSFQPSTDDVDLKSAFLWILGWSNMMLRGQDAAVADAALDDVTRKRRLKLVRQLIAQARKMVDGMQTGERHPVVLILSKEVQHLPWESLPAMQGQIVTRVPSLSILRSLLAQQHHRRRCRGHQHDGDYDASDAFFVLNPGGDLCNTQAAFEQRFTDEVGWDGVVGKPPSLAEFKSALQDHDLYVYCGHGTGEQFVSADRLKEHFSILAPPTFAPCGDDDAGIAAPRTSIRAVALLMGCSSGLLKGHAKSRYEVSGMALAYLAGGCPALVANLWDVTDKDIDRFSHALLDHLFDDEGHRVGAPGVDVEVSEEAPAPLLLPNCMERARASCKLRYLIGASPVCYGLPIAFHRRREGTASAAPSKGTQRCASRTTTRAGRMTRSRRRGASSSAQ